MAYINFSASEVCVLIGTTYVPNKTPGISLLDSTIIRAVNGGAVDINGNPILTIYTDDFLDYTVLASSAGVQAMKASDEFIVVDGESVFYQLGNSWLNLGTVEFIFNKSKIANLTPVTESPLNGDYIRTQMLIKDALGNSFIYTAKTAEVLQDNDANVVFQPSTEFIYVNPLSLCYDVQIVNHDTGTTNIYHTAHPANTWTLESRYNVTPYGGFLTVFRSNDYSQYYLYFFDNNGNLVDTISGFGPGYQWGNLQYRMVYGTDNDNDLSVLKIFDGKNVRTHEFPYLANFNMSPFSEGDLSKNLYVPFVVTNGVTFEQNLYVSTPGGGLIELGYEWFDSAIWAAVHVSSDKIFRAFYADGKYTKVEVWSEEMVLLSTLDLSGYNVDNYGNREYYGSDGHLYIYFYNGSDNTVPYLFCSCNSSTGVFATFTAPDNGTLKFSNYFRDYDMYDDYNSKGNSLVVITGLDGAVSPISGFADYQSGAVIHWTSTTTGEWFSYTVVGTGDVQISNSDGAYGTYPLFILDKGTTNLRYAVLLQDGTVNDQDSGIVKANTTAVSTFATGDYTFVNYDQTGGDVEWQFFGLVQEGNTTTSNNFDWGVQGSTVLLVDNDDNADSWAWAPSVGLLTVGNGFPVPTSYFNRVSDTFGVDFPVYGYVNKGSQVLVDKDGSDNVVGFYFLTEDSNGFVHVINTFDDSAGPLYVKKGNTRFLYVCENVGDGVIYAISYNMADGSLSSGITLQSADGPVGLLNSVAGDRFYLTQTPAQITFVYAFTQGGMVTGSYNAALGSADSAFNDAEWSWDD